MVGRFAWLLPVAMSAVIWAPLTQNYFVGDDFISLWRLTNGELGPFILHMHASHLLVARNIIFALCEHVFGLHAALYFTLVLVTHLVNVALLFGVVSWLTGSWRVGCVASGLWGIAPVNEGTLGWYSAYGHALTGTCTLWVLGRIARARAGVPVPPRAPWLWAAVIVVGSTCFGVGIGVALVMPAIAWLLLPRGPMRLIAVVAFTVAAVAVVGLYLALPRLYVALYSIPSPTGVYLPALDLVREARSTVHLVGVGVTAFALGALARPDAYPGMVGGICVATFALLVGGGLARDPRGTWRPLLAGALLALATYAMIAAGRFMFLKPGLAWMIQTPRYHYVGTIAAAIVFGVAIRGLDVGRWVPDSLKNLTLATWGALTLTLAFHFGTPINHFDDARSETAQVLDAVHDAARTAPEGEAVYIANRPFRAVGPILVNNISVFPGWAAVFAIFSPGDVADGHRIYFVIDDPKVLAAVRTGRRGPALLRGPNDPR